MRHDEEELFFLPGASGNAGFWKPVADRLRHPGNRRFVAWPGFGGVPAEPDVNGVRDLVVRVARALTKPTALLAQSMGGVVAVQVALERPELVRHLVLCVTSGGVDTLALGARDWRPDFSHAFPTVPRWFVEDRTDLSPRLHEVRAPALLLWGDQDPISPVAVGEDLAARLPRAELVVVQGGTHDLVLERADDVAPRIDAFLSAG